MAVPSSSYVYTESQMTANLASKVTDTQTIANALAQNKPQNVWLVRGGSKEGCESAVNTRSAGGEVPNSNCGRPTEAQVISQVGGSQPGVAQQKLPEFTSVAAKAEKWARRGGWLLVCISTEFLAVGDKGESGWVCLKTAPLVECLYIPHPKPLTGKAIPNAD